MKALHGTADTV